MIEISVSVGGRDELIAKLKVLKASLRQFNNAFDRIGTLMFDNAMDEAPEYTGALKGSHQLKSTAMQATVKAGGSNRRSHGGGIYVATQHNGGGATGMYGPHRINANPWLDRALVQSTPRAIAIIEEEVSKKIAEAGL
jgi:hypothetical protein